MHELWTTILAPVLYAARPGLVLDVGGEDERTAKLTANFVEPWEGRVARWRPGGEQPPGEAEVVLLHSDGEWPADELLDAVAAASEDAGRPLPIILVHGVEADGERLAAVLRFATARTGERAGGGAGGRCEALVVPGLGGVAIVTESPLAGDAYGRLQKLLEELRLSEAAARHVAGVEDRRLAERARAELAQTRLAAAQEQALEHETLVAEREELRRRVRELADAQIAGVSAAATSQASAAMSQARTARPAPPEPSQAGVRGLHSASVLAPPEPSQADVRELLNPAELLAELGWEGPEQSLGQPIPNNVVAEGQEFEWEWTAPAAETPALAIAYLLPGLPPEGSGGSHSLVQEARGLRALGALTHVCVPSDALERVQMLYGNEDELFVAYGEEDSIAQAVGGAGVVVSTEYTSVRLAERIARERPGVVCAYYVQDYEPLFAPPDSARSDDALLSYRAIPGQVLFAKTHWLRNVVMARHGVPVMKVRPSLDRSLFHAQGRAEREGAVRVAAMIRPRTPRRRAHATLRALQEIARSLGEGVQTLAFGCDAEAFAELRATLGVEDVVTHLGLLTRAEVAEVMRRTDVFIDASAYQAFGRTGLEAMACGAVPILPALGGVGEYAEHDRDAVIIQRDSPEEIAEAVCALVADRERLTRLREAGLRSASEFSIERAARSQLGLFAAVTTAAERVAVEA